MQVVTTVAELKEALANLSPQRALVMTMGALHEGHLSLVRKAKELGQAVVVSIYVNPLQFGPNEDYAAYPRQLAQDLELLAPYDVDVVFAPSDEQMYRRTPLVRIDPGPVATILEGKTRPGHFAGVLQVVHKVFNLVQPRWAIFGQKDAQQLALIRTMVTDLDMDLEIVAAPIRRESSGLAMSSRNTYLSAEQTEVAQNLSKSLYYGQQLATQGWSAPQIAQAVREYLGEYSEIKIDYVEVVDPETFLSLTADYRGNAQIVLAAWVGTTRLIDNMEVVIG